MYAMMSKTSRSRRSENAVMKVLTITAQPTAAADWVHRFRNFGEEVYVRLRHNFDIDIAEIDAAVDEFHVGGVPDEEAEQARREVTALASEHFLQASVFVTAADGRTHHKTVVLVLDRQSGEALWEIAGRHATWIVGSDVNRAAVEELRAARAMNAPEITLWSKEFDLVTEQDWLDILATIDTHHGVYASDPPMNRLSVYGASVTPAATAALRAYEFSIVLPTASGFIALKE
jgi:hypothetical protein